MNFLETIIKEKIEFVKQRKKKLSKVKLINKIGLPLAEFKFKSILKKPGLHLIAEIKRASPSKGELRPGLDVVGVASIYQRQGLELVSILTEEKFFKGSSEDLARVKQNTGLSILCKDFIIDSYQIYEAKFYGANAVLLIAKILSRERLKKFINIAKNLGMDAVVEIHNKTDLKKALGKGLGVEIIGINHRNLEDFSVDLEITENLLSRIPKEKLVIAESGIKSSQEIKYFRELGVNGVLIGESLMLAKDIAEKLKEFMDALK